MDRNLDAAFFGNHVAKSTMVRAYDRHTMRECFDDHVRGEILQARDDEEMGVAQPVHGFVTRNLSVPLALPIDSKARCQTLPLTATRPITIDIQMPILGTSI